MERRDKGNDRYSRQKAWWLHSLYVMLQYTTARKKMNNMIRFIFRRITPKALLRDEGNYLGGSSKSPGLEIWKWVGNGKKATISRQISLVKT